MICGEGDVGIVEDEERGVTAEFEGDALEGACGALHDGFSGCGGSGEAEVPDFGVADECVECVGAGGGEDLDHAARETCLGEDWGDGEGGEGGEFGRFPEGGASGGEGGGEFFCALSEGEIPRGDEGGDADGTGFDTKLTGGVGMGTDSAGVASGFLSEPLEEAGCVVDFGCGLSEGFALFEGDDAGEILFSREEECGGSFEDVAAFEGGHGLPCGLDSRCVSGCGYEGCGVGEGDGGEWLSGGGVDDFALVFGVSPLAIEPE